MRKLILLAIAGLSVLAATAAATSPVVHAAAGGRLAPGDWTTYHRDNARDGYAPDVAPLSTLSADWNATLDGPVYGQPLVVGHRIFAATENDTVYALDPDTGNVLWSVHAGTPEPLSDLPCGDIDPLGITSTMVYDPASNRVFAVAETTGGAHTLLGMNAATGMVEVRVPLEPPLGDPIAHQQRGALTLLDGRIYVPFGGLFGDCGSYIGSVVSVTTNGTGLRSYAVPTTREAGIWATGGGVVDGGHLLYASGNGASDTTYDGSDSIIALTPGLHRTDLFAPSDWAVQNDADEDLGSMSPALVGGYVYADGKGGAGYVLRPYHLGGVGGQVAELDNGCYSFGGSAVVRSTVYLPCTTGLTAVSVAADGTPTQLWRSTAPSDGSPVIGGGAVWVVNRYAGILYALDPGTGAVVTQVHIGQTPEFTSPTLSGDRAYVATVNGVAAVGGV
jgi:outer membrane protein assembly factor BamB